MKELQELRNKLTDLSLELDLKVDKEYKTWASLASINSKIDEEIEKLKDNENENGTI